MAAGEFRRQDEHLLLLASYSTVIGMATEVEVLRALGHRAQRALAGPAPGGAARLPAVGSAARRGPGQLRLTA